MKKMSFGTQSRIRVTLDCSHPRLVDDSLAAACDINNIMDKFKKSGMLPHFPERIPRFTDNTNIPSLEEAQEIYNRAKNAFMQLPAQIRKLMDNDPTQMDDFLANEDNAAIMKKYGLLIDKKADAIVPSIAPQPAVAPPEANQAEKA